MPDNTEKIVDQNRQMVAMTRMVRLAVAFEPENTRKALRVMATVEAKIKDGEGDVVELSAVWKRKWDGIQETANRAIAAAEQMASETDMDEMAQWSEETFRAITTPAIAANKEMALPLINQLRIVREALVKTSDDIVNRVKMRDLCDQLDEISAAAKQGLMNDEKLENQPEVITGKAEPPVNDDG